MAKKGTDRRKTFYIDLDIHRNPTGKTLAKPIKCITTGFLVYTKIEEYHFFDEQTITRHQKLRYKSKTETKPYIGPSGDVEISTRFIGLIAKGGCFSQAENEEGLYIAVIPEYAEIYFSKDGNSVVSNELIIFKTKEAFDRYEEEHRVTPINEYRERLVNTLKK